MKKTLGTLLLPLVVACSPAKKQETQAPGLQDALTDAIQAIHSKHPDGLKGRFTHENIVLDGLLADFDGDGYADLWIGMNPEGGIDTPAYPGYYQAEFYDLSSWDGLYVPEFQYDREFAQNPMGEIDSFAPINYDTEEKISYFAGQTATMIEAMYNFTLEGPSDSFVQMEYEHQPSVYRTISAQEYRLLTEYDELSPEQRKIVGATPIVAQLTFEDPNCVECLATDLAMHMLSTNKLYKGVEFVKVDTRKDPEYFSSISDGSKNMMCISYEQKNHFFGWQNSKAFLEFSLGLVVFHMLDEYFE